MAIEWDEIFAAIKKFVEVFTKWLDEVGGFFDQSKKEEETTAAE